MATISDASPILPNRAWYLTFVVFLAYVIGQVDRQIMVMLAAEMKRSLLFSDEQLGVLMGLAFSFTYATGALVFANVADRVGRKPVLIGAIVMWSLMTAVCALTKSFPGLVTARLAVGLFEGALAPAALPMVSAAFTAEKRSLPIALCVSGSAVGAVLTPIMTGLIVGSMAGVDFGPFPLIGVVHGWQTAFLVAGAAGLVVALLLTRISNVRDAQTDDARDRKPGHALRQFRAHWKHYLAVLAAVPIAATPGFALNGWMPAYLERTYALTPEQVGGMISAAFVPAALTGPFLGGLLGQFLARLGNPRRCFDIALGLGIAMNVAFALPMLMPTGLAAAITFGAVLLVMNVFMTLGMINSQQLVPAPLRSQATAMFMAIQLMIGNGMGPYIVGFFATRFVGEDALHLAMLMLIAITLPLAAAIFIAARRNPLNIAADTEE